MKRKIIMLCGIWHEDYIRGLLRGIRNRMEESDVELHIFASYAIYNDDAFSRKECEVYSLPNLDDYDGILIANNNQSDYRMVKEKIEYYQNHGKPILSVEQSFEGTSYTGVDNYAEFYKITEHILKEHGCRIVNYLGGPDNNAENLERYRAFCDCMKAYGIEVEPSRVLHMHFLHHDGEEAYEYWKMKGMHMPDAVLCANDNMALGYCNAAMVDGYSAPEDFLITGFDNFDEGQYFCPSITSVNRNWEQLGYDSLDKLLEIIDGEVEPGVFHSSGRLALNESCGCGLDKRDIRGDFREVYHAKKQEESLEIRQRISRQDLSISSHLSHMQQKLNSAYDVLEIEDMALCLNNSLFEEDLEIKKDGYDDVMYVAGRDTHTKMEREFTLDISKLNLRMAESHRIFIFSALHLDGDTYGYSVAPYQDNFMKNHLHRTFMETISLALVNIRQREILNRLNLRLEQLYVQDQMTGLYNRFGYMNQAQAYMQKYDGNVYLFYMDMDNLKVINDRYGHAVGDKAIKGVAYAIRKVFADNSVCVRMGGDEFLVMKYCKSEEEVKQKIDKMNGAMEEYGAKNNLPLPIAVSVGYVNTIHNREPLEILVKKADAKMYETKQKHKEMKQ